MNTIDYNIFELNRNKEELSETEIEYLNTLDIKQIESYITYCNSNYNYYNAIQTGLKLILNSIYGAFGNEYFVCSTKDIAGAITAMGRDVVKYMDNINEKYWYDFWHLDEELHAHLGIDTANVKAIDNSWIHRESKTPHYEEVTQTDIVDGEYQRLVPVSNYVDTDSLFVGFQPAMNSCNWTEDEQDFVWKICKFRLEKIFKAKLIGYAKKYKVENLQEFELENINESVLFVTKKNYIKHVIWEDGMQYNRLTNITPKGVSLIKKGTPNFARTKVMDIINYIFDNSKTYNIKDLLKFVRDLKKEFELTSIDEIAPTGNINNYWSSKLFIDGQTIDGPGIVEDREDLIMGKLTYFVIKSAGLYNHLLYKHAELINDYEVIRPGTKVRIYPCIHELNDKFCYIPGACPIEFAPPIDYDTLFETSVSNQVNYYLKALNLPILNKRLKIVISLFD
jgi:hypothetical protein